MSPLEQQAQIDNGVLALILEAIAPTVDDYMIDATGNGTTEISLGAFHRISEARQLAEKLARKLGVEVDGLEEEAASWV